MVLHSFVPVSRFRDDPIDILRHVQRGLEDVWGMSSHPSPTEAAALSVRLDVKEDAEAYHVTAELPGLDENNIETTFEDGVLTIRGEKKLERDDKKDTWHILERSQGSFSRQVSLPAKVNADKIDAHFSKGVLKITLPKVAIEQLAARKITIKAA